METRMVPKFALLTYQKAASQWAKDVLFGPRTLALVPGAELHGPESRIDRLRAWSERPDLTCSGPFYNVSYPEWAMWSTPEDRAVHVHRDPRDRLISWVFSMSYSHFSYPEVEAIRSPLCSLDLRDRISFAIAGSELSATWMARSWVRPAGPRNHHSVSFERLIEEPAREYAAIFECFGWAISPQQLDEILQAHAYEVRSGGRARGVTNEMSHYRRGLAGDWRNYFDRDLGRLFEENYPHALVDLGYEADDAWFEALPVTVEATARTERAIVAKTFEAEADRLHRRNESLESAIAAQAELIREYGAIAGASAPL